MTLDCPCKLHTCQQGSSVMLPNTANSVICRISMNVMHNFLMYQEYWIVLECTRFGFRKLLMGWCIPKEGQLFFLKLMIYLPVESPRTVSFHGETPDVVLLEVFLRKATTLRDQNIPQLELMNIVHDTRWQIIWVLSHQFIIYMITLEISYSGSV